MGVQPSNWRGLSPRLRSLQGSLPGDWAKDSDKFVRGLLGSFFKTNLQECSYGFNSRNLVQNYCSLICTLTIEFRILMDGEAWVTMLSTEASVLRTVNTWPRVVQMLDLLCSTVKCKQRGYVISCSHLQTMPTDHVLCSCLSPAYARPKPSSNMQRAGAPPSLHSPPTKLYTTDRKAAKYFSQPTNLLHRDPHQVAALVFVQKTLLTSILT